MSELIRRLAAVAFADVAGWSRLVEKNDVETLRAWKALRAEVIEPKIEEHGGRLLEIAGDSVLVEFPSAVAAVNWATEVQKSIVDAARGPESLTVRIGINVEDVIVDGDKLVGSGVNIASRIHQLASPGEIIVSETVYDYVRDKVSTLAFVDLGEQTLKNISRPVRLFRIDAPHAVSEMSFDHLPQESGRALLAIDLPGPAHTLTDAIVKNVVPARAGQVVVRDSNRLFVEFVSAQQAAAAALDIQRIGRGSSPSELPRMALQVTDAATNAYSRGVDFAARLMSLAGPGEIIASAPTRDALTPVLDADIEDLGECYLREMRRAVRAYRLGEPGPEPVIEAATMAELRPTIAVIPFTARALGHELLGEVLADEVISGLSSSTELNVISRLSTTAFRGRNATPQEIGKQLNANYVVSGAYRVTQAHFTVPVELAEARSGRALWSREVSGRVAGIMEGKDRLVDQIVADVSAAVIAREMERARSQSLPTLESYTLLIAAITLMHRLSQNDFDRAKQMLYALIERTRHLAIPLAWLAKWHVLRVQQGWSGDPHDDTQSALDCTKRALDNDSHCALALAIDGFVHTNLLKQLDVGEERYDLALSINPNDPLAWLLKGTLHAFKGEGLQAVKGTRRALRLSPLDPHRYFYDSLAASAALSAADYEGAIELARRSLRANRTHTSTYRVMAISQWQLGRHKEARDTVRELMRLEPTLTVSKWLERSPSSAYEIGRICALALREAGVPQ